MLDIALPGYAYRLLQAPAQPLVAGVGGVGAADAGGRIAELRALGRATEIPQVKRGVGDFGLRPDGDAFRCRRFRSRVCQLHRAHHHAGELAHAQIRGVRALE